MPDYYELLQVHPSASDKVIRMAYKALLQDCHPDKNPSPDAHRQTLALKEAYDVLSDPDKRAAYDRERSRGANRERPQEPPPRPNAEPRNHNGNTAAESGAKVQPAQREAAEALGLPVIFRNTLQSGGLGPVMVVVPAGHFLMGSPKGEPKRRDVEGPQHVVTFARPFAIGRYAVTFDEYDLFCRLADRPAAEDEGWGRGNRPVIHVSWEDAVAYCAWLSGETGKRYRLPSEAEWEYACRAGTTTAYGWGNDISPRQANYWNSVHRKTVEVNQYEPNSFGLYQMHGNVCEWCADEWHDNYQGAPVDGSAWVSAGGGRWVLRGGSWNGAPGYVRSANRLRYNPTYPYRGSTRGFRLAQD
ncbi:MAG: SUMF1/EgtB/PvdO family nonheme iron enzyme [Candidatus Methylumidiphilus sp.]